MPNTYQPGVPTGSVKLNQDYKNIRGNFAQLNTTFGIDHTTIDNATAQNGYHTTVHLIPFSSGNPNFPLTPLTTPPAVASIGELFCCKSNDGYATDTNLYYQTGTGRNYQMTCNFTPSQGSSSSNAGKTFLPGGIVMQWGVVNGTHGSAPQTFNDGDTGTVIFSGNNISFSTKLVTVICTLEYFTSAPSGRANVVVDQNSFSTTGFTWVFLSGGSSSYTRFNWIAIGF